VRFDADPKYWRFLSTVLMDTACFMELLLPAIVTAAATMTGSPMGGGYAFVAVASVANVLKNISFLTTSACRASIHKSFAAHENLADVTAKSGSQAMLASMAGTSAGIFVVSMVAEDTYAKIGTFVLCSAGNFLATYLSLSQVTVKSLTCDRLFYILEQFMQSLPNNHCGSNSSPENEFCPTALNDIALLTPEEVRQSERFLSAPPLNSDHAWTVHIGAPLATAFPSSLALKASLDQFVGLPYVVSYREDNKRVDVLIRRHAGRAEVLKGLIHGFCVRQAFASGGAGDVERQYAYKAWGSAASKLQFVDYVADRLMNENKWIVDEMTLETSYARIEESKDE
jgi:hypothetical protein